MNNSLAKPHVRHMTIDTKNYH